MEQSLNKIIENAIKKNWNNTALTDFGGVNLQFRQVAVQIERIHIIFEKAGIKRGDKIAICGKNSANWATTFLACLTGGFVAVPILHEFKPETIHHLVNHSEAKMLFADSFIYENIDDNAMPQLLGIMSLQDFSVPFSPDPKVAQARARVNEYLGKKYPSDFTKEDVKYYEDKPQDLAIINYTSGSTGMSKGVMLPYLSLWSNIRYCLDHLDFLLPGDGVVNMLPLAHLYGMTIEMLHPFVKGCHCYFLTRLPSPKVILNAFAEVRPKLIITVPLILEKIIKGKIFPILEKPLMKLLLSVPFVDDKVLAKVKAQLTQAFGGQVREIIIGGAGLNADVEKFLRRIGFPYTVGYGMTECGPLIAYVPSDRTKYKSCGMIVDRMMCKVDSKDPANVPGNLWVKGDNVMQGYYKNDKATSEAMPEEDGWLNTGDLCTVDEDGYITICGRSKTMILGPSGQNIYPEEIEQKLDNLPYVAESLVIDDGGKLIALIYPDLENLNAQGIDTQGVDKIMKQNLVTLNQELPSYCKVSGFKLFDEEFEKTPKRSIKRFLYQP